MPSFAMIRRVEFDEDLSRIKSEGGDLIKWRSQVDISAAKRLAGSIFSGVSAAVLFSLTHFSAALSTMEFISLFGGLIAVVAVFAFGIACAIAVADYGANPFAVRLRTIQGWKYLRAVRAVLKSKRTEFKNLRERARRFNKALEAFTKAEKLMRVGDDGVGSEAWYVMNEQSEALNEELMVFCSELKDGLAGLQKKRRLMCKSAAEIRDLNERRKSFRKRVAALSQLYADLPGYDAGTLDSANVTREFAPYLVVQEMRDRLEAECEELGLSPSLLPPRLKDAPRLSAKAGG